MNLSVIIVNYNVYEDVVKCVNSLKANLDNIDYEIIIVDNNSEEKAIKGLNEVFPEVKLVLLNENLGYGTANNAAMKLAAGKFFLIINPDIVVIDNSIAKLIAFLESNPDAGIASPLLLNPDSSAAYYNTYFPTIYSRTMQEFGRLYLRAGRMKKRIYGFLKENIDRGEPFKVEQVMGACMMINKEVYEKTGGFDEDFFLFEEETDWELRINKCGWNIYILPGLRVIHNHHTSTAKAGKYYSNYHEIRSRLIFSIKHFGFFSEVYIRFLIFFASSIRFIKNLIYCVIGRKNFSTEFLFYILIFKLVISSKRRIYSKFDAKYVSKLKEISL